MAVCNLFKKITKDTGTFFMFSQYTEDLTKMATQTGLYKVTPSKFIALNLSYIDFDNDTFPYYLQSAFENGCAYLRENETLTGEIWTPQISANLFWNALVDAELISQGESISQSDNSIPCINEIKYVGDINFQSYDEHAGMGYSEIYCYIPNEAKRIYLECVINSNESETGISYPNEYAMGYSEKDQIDGVDLTIPTDTKYFYNGVCNFNFDSIQEGDEESFDINTIVVLYDIEVQNSDGIYTQYKNIPLGLYIPGKIANGTVTNYFTKYVNNEDIYYTGTAYGLRICSRFTPTPNNDNIKTVDITTDNSYAAVCKVMSEFSKTQDKMNEVVESIYSEHGMFKDELSMFKNYRTNIPYIKVINDKNYWFVNGQNTGVEAEGGSNGLAAICTAYSNQEVQDHINLIERNIEEIIISF